MASGGRGAFGAVAEWLEAPPADWIARQPNYPWLVVAVACIGAFIGQSTPASCNSPCRSWNGSSTPA
jgi:hypothetical protein